MPNETVTFLTKFKKLVKAGKCHFEERIYEDGRTYLQVLVEDFHITVREAWTHILGLNYTEHFPDPKMDAYKSQDTHCFKRTVNHVDAYIKIQIMTINDTEESVVVSFHPDRWQR